MTRDHGSTGVLLDHAKAILTLHVTDLYVAVHSYSRVFGTGPVRRGTDTNIAGDNTSYAVFVLAGMTVFLSDARGPDVPCGKEHHPPTLVFMTKRPLSELRRVLESRGAHFRDDEVVDGFPTDADGVRAGRSAAFLRFYDPTATEWNSAGCWVGQMRWLQNDSARVRANS